MIHSCFVSVCKHTFRTRGQATHKCGHTKNWINQLKQKQSDGPSWPSQMTARDKPPKKYVKVSAWAFADCLFNHQKQWKKVLKSPWNHPLLRIILGVSKTRSIGSKRSTLCWFPNPSRALAPSKIPESLDQTVPTVASFSLAMDTLWSIQHVLLVSNDKPSKKIRSNCATLLHAACHSAKVLALWSLLLCPMELVLRCNENHLTKTQLKILKMFGQLTQFGCI